MSIIELNHIYTGEELQRKAILLANTYSGILTLESVGKSHDNREIMLLRLGKSTKNIILVGGVHGRETINSSVLLRVMEEYCKMSLADKSIFSETGILCVPLLNPDGYAIATEGFGVIGDKNLRRLCVKTGQHYSMWKWNARAVDINRNFVSTSFTETSHTGKCNSENETKALVQLIEREETTAMIDFHSRGESIYYYRNAMNCTYNIRQKTIADRFALLSGYRLESPSDEIDYGDSGGNTVHYYSEHTQNPAFTIETGSEDMKFPMEWIVMHQTFLRIKDIPLELLK